MEKKEEKLEVIETLHCPECGKEFSYNVFWNRDYRIRMKRFRIEHSPINSDHFHSLCPEHKLKYFKKELVYYWMKGIIRDWDLKGMGIDAGKL
jgi:hypothetical protein